MKIEQIKDMVCEEKPTSVITFTQIVDVAQAKENYLFNKANQDVN